MQYTLRVQPHFGCFEITGNLFEAVRKARTTARLLRVPVYIHSDATEISYRVDP